ncbi:MAG: PBP1A family penicillin-binding protein [Lachnospiraceae bacterium]|nr:PBP1A family penicillin-binding protein [Lachnospiraceae bacterium]
MDLRRDVIIHRLREYVHHPIHYGNLFKGLFIKVLTGLVVAGIICSVTFVYGCFEGILSSTPDISHISVAPTKFATKIYDQNGVELETLIAEGSNRIYVELPEIPLKLQQAFIAIEDERYYSHNGIDLKGISRAAYVAATTKDLSQGASTITQQLIKNTVFDPYNESTLQKIKRKLQEQYLALHIDKTMGKDAVLENYLNIINLGNGNLGVQCAANNYFNKDVSELTISECAVIAAITKNPVGYNPITHPEKNKERQQQVLANMFEQGYITETEYQAALSDKVYDRIQDIHVEMEDDTIYSYFTDTLIEVIIGDLMDQYGYTKSQATSILYTGGLTIYSTQDIWMQEVAEEIINDPANYPEKVEYSITLNITAADDKNKAHYFNHNDMMKYFQEFQGRRHYELIYYEEETVEEDVESYLSYLEDEGYTILDHSYYIFAQPQVSFSLMDQHTGEVKVLVGGRGEKVTNRSINRATNTYRSPGSSIKPLAVYGPALDTETMTLATVIDDCPYYYSFGGKLVTNYNKQYRGLMSFREALYRSQNVPAVKILATITPEVGVKYLQKFGLTTVVTPAHSINGLHDAVESLALGGMTLGVFNIEMCAAYATYANEGVYNRPRYYTQVYDHDGKLLLDSSDYESHRVVKSSTAWLMTNALESVVTLGTGGAKCKIPNMSVGGKTGTSNSDGDFWFCGYTPYYTAAIWTGYDNDSTKNLNGKVDHRKIWGSIMTTIHEDLPPATFEEMPKDIVKVEICSQSGMLPAEGLCSEDERGSMIVSEYFTKSTAPTSVCDAHGYYNICEETGLVSLGTCPLCSPKIRVRRPENNITVPEEYKDYHYDLPDAPYTVPYEYTKAVCPLHALPLLSIYGYTENTRDADPITPNAVLPSVIMPELPTIPAGAEGVEGAENEESP